MSLISDSNTARQFDRLPPHDIDAEMCLLASMMLDSGVRRRCRSLVCREDFYQADHQIIFDSICRLSEKGNVDATILASDLRRCQLLEECGGVEYLGSIINSVPSAAHGPQYAEVVRERATARGLIATANEILRSAYAPLPDSASELVDRACTSLAKLNQSRLRSGSTKSLGEVLVEVRERLASDDSNLIPSGFPSLDRIMGGFALGENWVLGGRPSMGKSLLAKQIAVWIAEHVCPVAVFAFEEGRFKIGKNILASAAQVENKRMRQNRTLTDADWDRMNPAIERLSKLPIFINDRLRSLDEVRSELAALVAGKGVQFAVIDHLGLINAGGKGIFERTSNASNGIAMMMRDLGVAGLTLAQLNRNTETARRFNQTSPRPTLGDLRNSGEIEQDADGVLLIHREDYYHIHEMGYQPTHEVEINIAKMRDGERGGTPRLQSHLALQTFTDIQQPEEPSMF